MPDGSFRPLSEHDGVGVMAPAPAVIPAAAFVQQIRDQARPADDRSVSPPRKPKTRDASEPVNAIRVLRERRKWLLGEVKRLKKFEAELEELDRMLKPASPVRSIDSARRVTG